MKEQKQRRSLVRIGVGIVLVNAVSDAKAQLLWIRCNVSDDMSIATFGSPCFYGGSKTV